MPQYLQIPATEDFGGLSVCDTPDDINKLDTPDARNEDISEPGSSSKRNGLEKTNTSAYASQLNYMVAVTVKGKDYKLYITNTGSMVVI